MNYYNVIKENLIKSEIYDRAKDYSKDRHKVKVYFEIWYNLFIRGGVLW